MELQQIVDEKWQSYGTRSADLYDWIKWIDTEYEVRRDNSDIQFLRMVIVRNCIVRGNVTQQLTAEPLSDEAQRTFMALKRYVKAPTDRKYHNLRTMSDISGTFGPGYECLCVGAIGGAICGWGRPRGRKNGCFSGIGTLAFLPAYYAHDERGGTMYEEQIAVLMIALRADLLLWLAQIAEARES